MDYNEYAVLARKTAKPEMPLFERMRHSALGCGSDMGEVATLVKKLTQYGATLQTIDKKEGKTILECFKEELGDVCWFITEGLAGFHLSFDDIVYFPNHDSAYSSRLHVDDGIDYWTMKGLAAAGRLNDLVSTFGKEENFIRMDYTVKQHLSNIFTCVCQIAYRLQIGMDHIYDYNIDKLHRGKNARYKDGVFSEQAALDRRDKSGV